MHGGGLPYNNKYMKTENKNFLPTKKSIMVYYQIILWSVGYHGIPKNNTVEEYRGRAIVNVTRIVQKERYFFATVLFST